MQTDFGLLIMRVSFGATMLFAHGWGKMVNFSAAATKFPDPIGVGSKVSLGLAIFAEVFCSLALILGIKTRWAAVPLLITMLVAVFLVHAGDPWQKQEFGLLYAYAFLTLIFTGGGRFSLDQLLEK